MISRTITTPRRDGAVLQAAFTVSENVPEGSRCMSCNEHVGPGKYHECWSLPASVDRSPEGEKPQTLSAKHESAVAESDAPKGVSCPPLKRKPMLRIVGEERVFGSPEFIARDRNPALPSPRRFVPTVKAPGDVVI